MQYDSEKQSNNFHFLDDNEIFKTYKASPLKFRENQENIGSYQNLKKNNVDHDFSGDHDNDDAFSFSNNNESPSKDLLDLSAKKSKVQQSHKKTNSLNETPFYNAKVNNKQEFFYPENIENEFGQLESKERFQNEKTKKKNYNKDEDDGDSEKKNKDVKIEVSQNVKNVSSQIMKNNEYKNRWDFLHEMSKTQREALNVLREKKQKEIDNDPNLTFKPKLLKNSKMSSDFHQRNKIWSDNKKDKIEHKKLNDQDKDLEHCTFQPLLNDNNSKIINFNSNKYSLEGKGVEQFLRRQILARQAKEEKQALMAHLFFTQSHEERKLPKGSNITFPKEFRLGNSNLKCPSIKKDFQKALSPTKYRDIYSLQENNCNNLEGSRYNEEKLREIFQNPNDIHMEKIPFGQAIRELHGELHKLDLEMD